MNDNNLTSARYFVNPEFRSGADIPRAEVVNPATLEKAGERLVCDADTVAAVVAEANIAQVGWATLSAKARAAALHRIADSIENANPEQVGILMTREMGKPYPESVGEIANDSEFGLGACVFTTDLNEAMEAAERLQSGLVWVNNPLIDNDALPFGGWKLSGLGRELSRQGLDAFRRSKMVIIDHKPEIKEWWYPYPDDWFHESGGRKL